MTRTGLRDAIDHVLSLQPSLKVFPIKHASKAPDARWAPNGVHDATRDPTEIGRWPEQVDAYGVVGATGLVGVIDVDDPSIYERIPWLPSTFTVRTSKGAHHYLLLDRPVEDFVVKTSHADERGAVMHREGASFRCTNRYVLGPGSRHPDGTTYTIENDAPIAAAPPEFYTWALTQRTAVSREHRDPAAIYTKGGRRDFLKSRAAALRNAVPDQQAILAALRVINEERCDPPMREDVPTSHDDYVDLEGLAEWASQLDDWNGSSTHEDPPSPAATEERWLAVHDMPEPEPIVWLREPYLPFGRLVVLDGKEGSGKGLMAVYAATQVARSFGAALWLSSEDDPVDDIQVRLRAAGYDPAAHHPIFVATYAFQIPRDIEMLEADIRAHGARLVILDPGRSFIHRTDGSPMSYNDETAVRPALEALNALAKRTGACVIFVHHHAKDHYVRAEDRFSGSAAFSQVPRHRLTVQQVDKNGTTYGAFAISKSNLTQRGQLHGFNIKAKDITLGGREFIVPVFGLGAPITNQATLSAWARSFSDIDGDGKPIDHTDDDLALLPADGGEISARKWRDQMAGDNNAKSERQERYVLLGRVNERKSGNRTYYSLKTQSETT
jgi:hypothetical protein